MRRGLMAIAMLLTSTDVVSQAPNSQTTRFSVARKLIQDGLVKDSAPGLAIAVARGDSILWEEGLGWADPEKHIPVTVNTPFYLASTTKTITATALMILRERDRLDLDRPANDYLGAAKLWSPRWNAADATVRRLATHRSGLTTFDLGCPTGTGKCPFPSMDELIRRYGVLTRPPGEAFDYSNLGYDILGEVVAHAAGKDLGAFMRDEIFKPLGMTHSTLGVDSTATPAPAVPYYWVRGRAPHPLQTLAASTGYSSVHDLVRFGQMHVKVRPPGARAILSDAAIDTMQLSVVPAGSQRSYGIGWWVEDRFGYRSLLAQGGTPGSSTWLRIIPSERVVVVVLANKGVSFASNVVDAAIAELLPRYAALLQSTQQAPATSAPVPAAQGLDTSFVGAWTGVVLTESGEVKMQLTVRDSGAVRATFSSRPGESPGRARFSSGLFRLTITGDLTTADSTHEARIFFYLRPGNGVMNGAVTQGMSAASGLEGRVSYWVELRRPR
jgi:CubicO group peptidase (beta-lactamase class C family)